MTVAELITELQKLPPELKVVAQFKEVVQVKEIAMHVVRDKQYTLVHNVANTPVAILY